MKKYPLYFAVSLPDPYGRTFSEIIMRRIRLFFNDINKDPMDIYLTETTKYSNVMHCDLWLSSSYMKPPKGMCVRQHLKDFDRERN